MMIPILAAEAFCVVTTAFQVATTAIAIVRCKPPATPLQAPPHAPAVSLVRPVCGIENYVEETLASALALDYPCYEIVFCVASAQDPVVPTVRRLMAAHPNVPVRLLVGNEKISDNPKLNNVYKGWRAATHDWIVLADSNVFMPPDYIQRLMSAWRPASGLVCSPPIGGSPAGFWAEVECAFLNTYQARFQYAADTIGLGFAQGKSMLWQRRILEDAGGIRALASELAEDAAATKVVRGAGLRVRLVDAPFEQPLGHRSAGEVWRRQVRWARLRRTSFKSYFMPEILAGGTWPLAAAAFAAAQSDLSFASVPALAALWYGCEAVLAWTAGWHITVRSPLAWALRDVLLPAIWFNGWLGSAFVWRGNEMRPVESFSSKL
ncbi:MAG TPA: ceramide glucosyltransferase [Xanthobacteraceae bacterium]|jgi:ceramide glucosyltransferase